VGGREVRVKGGRAGRRRGDGERGSWGKGEKKMRRKEGR